MINEKQQIDRMFKFAVAADAKFGHQFGISSVFQSWLQTSPDASQWNLRSLQDALQRTLGSLAWKWLVCSPFTWSYFGILLAAVVDGVTMLPTFMPVATQAAIKGLTSQQMESLGVTLILNNTYHLNLRPGLEVLKTVGGAHNFQGWNRNLLTVCVPSSYDKPFC